ncbi:MAG: hypothetical protein PHF63_00790 [Herbinix sp.]|nr:hypothetical protein [Herbinix sp.]
MSGTSYALRLVLENATYKEKQKIYCMEQAELENIDNAMMKTLYDSILKKSRIDFENIPNSKGDITAYSGYGPMMSTLDIIKRLLSVSSVSSSEIMEVENCIINLKNMKPVFERGFKMNNSFVQLLYCSMVASCIESTSLLSSAYIDFVKFPINGSFKLKIAKENFSYVAFDSIKQFNKSVASGSMTKALKASDIMVKESFIAVGGITAAVIIAVLSVIPVLRELIFYFFYSKMKISEYLDYQKNLIELNETRIGKSSDIKDREKVIKKQNEMIKRLEGMSDKMRVNSVMSTKLSKDAIKKENKSFNLDSVESNSSSFIL